MSTTCLIQTVSKSPYRKNKYTPAEKLGLVFISRGQLHGYSLINVIHNETIRFKVDKTNFPPGVAQAILFNSDGEILCDRLLFNYKDNQLNIQSKTSKETYEPYEAVDMEFYPNRPGSQSRTNAILLIGERRHERN